MRTLLNQLRVRLILGFFLFLLGLSGAVVLVVSDSLLFCARNMMDVGTQALLEQRQSSLLEIAQREAELSDHAVHHDPSDLAPLSQRLSNLSLTPYGFAFVMDADGKLVMASSNRVTTLMGQTVRLDTSMPQNISLMEIENAELQEVLEAMQAGGTGIAQIELAAEPMLIAYAPLDQMEWSFAIVESVADISASAQPL